MARKSLYRLTRIEKILRVNDDPLRPFIYMGRKEGGVQYETPQYVGAVVCSTSKELAKLIHPLNGLPPSPGFAAVNYAWDPERRSWIQSYHYPDGRVVEQGPDNAGWVPDLALLNVERLGPAPTDVAPGKVLDARFDAGDYSKTWQKDAGDIIGRRLAVTVLPRKIIDVPRKD